MTVRESKGDLIAMAEAGHLSGIVHGCNCMHAMGSGIAGQLARKYLEVPLADENGTKHGDFKKLGTYTIAKCRSIQDPSIVFDVHNLYTQKMPSYDGNDVFEYEAFRLGCMKLLAQYEGVKGYKLGFPRIGAGLAGGDWEQIKQIIKDVFGKTKMQVFIIEWDAGVTDSSTSSTSN